MFSLENKTAIVTGAGSGIGKATAQRLKRAGANVVAADIVDCAEEASRAGCAFRQVDVGEPEQIAALCDYALEEYGSLDIMVNNAAISTGRMLAEVDSEENSLRFWRVNLLSAQMGTKEAAARMKPGGSIINLTSITALRGFPQWSEYGATKGGIIALTQTAAIEYGGAGVRVNAVAPGIINTPMAMREAPDMVEKNAEIFAPLGRIGTPEELAAAIHFLASDDASYITGQILSVDGGWSAGTSLQAFGMAMQS
ncbi:SDR family oxidoreductase [Spongiibacter sp. KMU-166]|uniref:SDR family oxidoreductase n=1 Tax=Spongiibacter thalassae TaxID=2721624 RepID=A0ABX1GDN1_9GAMM|nr:SDR family oxidoreductase [Spongiibacter thalassae]NKI16578.1 SDR family oxidoreductase [Spongiibacter thalassae]